MSCALIYLGGEGPDSFPAIDDEISAIIAADSGLALADLHEVNVDLVIGDMDSVDASLLSKYENSGSIISRFPHEKDETDFELSIMAAKNYNADSLIVIGGGGKRLDHLISNIAVLCGHQTENWNVKMYTQNEIVHVCRPLNSFEQELAISSSISLIPIGSKATGVTSSGLKWELDNGDLDVHSALGISNIVMKNEVLVSISTGVVAVIIPASI